MIKFNVFATAMCDLEYDATFAEQMILRHAQKTTTPFILLAPTETVIDKETVAKLIKTIENSYLGINEIEQWDELRKAVGVD